MTPPPLPQILPYSTPATVQELAAKPPMRDYLPTLKPPPEPEMLRALYLKPGHPSDSLKRVYVTARVHRDSDKPEGRLAHDFFLDGPGWPVAFREAIMRYLPMALTIEQRLAALDNRDRAERAHAAAEYRAKKDRATAAMKATRQAAAAARKAAKS